MQTLLEGFFPRASSRTMPARPRRVGLQELGLPYAADAAITRHLARFLRRQTDAAQTTASIRRGASGLACPTHVLFNGGVMKAAPLRRRVVEVLSAWLQEEGFEPLDDRPRARRAGPRPRGRAAARPITAWRGADAASGFAAARRGATTSASRVRCPRCPACRAPLKALCVVPFGMEEGTHASIADREFGLIVGEPAEFRFLSSTVRKADPVGALIEDWAERSRRDGPARGHASDRRRAEDVVPVTLESRVTETGTLELWCVAKELQDEEAA